MFTYGFYLVLSW